MAIREVDFTDVTNPNGVEGRMVDEDRVYDKETDTYPISQVHLWYDVYLGGECVQRGVRLTLGDGMIRGAVDKAYDVALSKEFEAQKAAHPEYSDEEAMDAAKLVVTRANDVAIWNTLRNLVINGGSSDEERRTLADTVAQTLKEKDTGAASWGLRLLKYGYTGKGL